MVGRHVGAAVGRCRGNPECRDHVDSARRPSVVVQERVVVGEPLPRSVELRVVPSTRYRYAVVTIVGDRRAAHGK